MPSHSNLTFSFLRNTPNLSRSNIKLLLRRDKRVVNSGRLRSKVICGPATNFSLSILIYRSSYSSSHNIPVLISRKRKANQDLFWAPVHIALPFT